MTIFDAEWRREFQNWVLPWLGAAHPDLTRIAGILRDTSIEVWTESPSDDSKVGSSEHYSMEGWRIHFGRQRQRLAAWDATHGSALQNFDSQAKTALDGFLTSVAAIGTVFTQIIANYEDASGNLIQTTVSQADRDTLAAAIEAELQ